MNVTNRSSAPPKEHIYHRVIMELKANGKSTYKVRGPFILAKHVGSAKKSLEGSYQRVYKSYGYDLIGITIETAKVKWK